MKFEFPRPVHADSQSSCAWRLAALKNPKFEEHLLVVLILLLSLDGGLGNTVQVTLAGLGDAAATLLLVVLKDTNLGKRLADLAVNGAGGVNVVGGAGAAVLGATVNLAETADTDGLAHVDVTGDSGGTDVVPECNLAEVRHWSRVVGLTSRCFEEEAP